MTVLCFVYLQEEELEIQKIWKILISVSAVLDSQLYNLN